MSKSAIVLGATGLTGGFVFGYIVKKQNIPQSNCVFEKTFRHQTR